jgi:hypothetical protein
MSQYINRAFINIQAHREDFVLLVADELIDIKNVSGV